MIQISDKTIGLWMILLYSDLDVLIHLYQKSENVYCVQCRKRFHSPVSKSPWDDADLKQWQDFEFKGSKDEALRSVRSIVAVMDEIAVEKSDEILMTTEKEFMATVSKKPWAHMKSIPIPKGYG